MKLAKWGNSGAFRIPSEALRKLNWQPGGSDNFNVVVGENEIRIVRDKTREQALEELRKMRFTLPDDYKFNRDEIYDE